MARITRKGDEEWNVPEPEPILVPAPVEEPTHAPADPGEVPAVPVPVEPEKQLPEHV